MFLHFSRKHGRISKRALERSLGHLRGPILPQHIVTLDPKKFAEKEQERLDISNLRCFTSRISLVKNISKPASVQLFYDQSGTRNYHPRYPPDTKAFLYYSIPPEKPRIAGELRLRVTSSDNPGSFESGSDLLMANGQPWFRPLYTLSGCIPLYEKLREDQLIPDDLDAVLSTLPSKKLLFRRSHFLYTLNDTFVVNFCRDSLHFFVITEHGVESLYFRFRDVFTDGRVTLAYRPYTGSALARFERSTVLEHKGTRTIVLRFLKIITPVKCVIPLYDGYISCPKEGELHRRRPDTVWSANIDKKGKKGTRGFQLLWDT